MSIEHVGTARISRSSASIKFPLPLGNCIIDTSSRLDLAVRPSSLDHREASALPTSVTSHSASASGVYNSCVPSLQPISEHVGTFKDRHSIITASQGLAERYLRLDEVEEPALTFLDEFF